MKNHILKNISYLFLILTIATASCKKFVTIEAPIDKVVADQVFTSDEVATAAIRGIYATMSTGGFASGGASSVTLLAGRSADEFTNTYTANELRKQFADNNLLSNNTYLQSSLWVSPYRIIYATNTVLENLKRSSQISAAVKLQLAAEAKFIRAFTFFYLTNLFGDVPLILSTDYRENAVAGSKSHTEIYAQIIKDLEEARAELSDNYPSADRTRACKWVATAMLAKVYLFTKDYVKAENYATELINKTERYNLISDDLNKVFLKNSQEAIFQLYVASPSYNTLEGNAMILNTAPGSTTEVVLSEHLYNAFENGDQRQSKWIGTFTSGTNTWRYAFKYKIKTGGTPLNEYSMVLRLAEQYLIRAESRVNQDKIDLGIADLNQLRLRARANPTTALPNPLPALVNGMNKENALLAVEQERRIELFSEWGHRWLDLKRTNRADAVLAPIKGSNWQSTDLLYPIPNSDLINNPNLKQNPGYN